MCGARVGENGKEAGGTRGGPPSGLERSRLGVGEMRRKGRRGWATGQAKPGRKEEKGAGLVLGLG